MARKPFLFLARRMLIASVLVVFIAAFVVFTLRLSSGRVMRPPAAMAVRTTSPRVPLFPAGTKTLRLPLFPQYPNILNYDLTVGPRTIGIDMKLGGR
jgi:hypothetical protein